MKNREPTPAFHPGEQLLQQRLGVREKMAEVGQRVIRDYMPEQHRTFFSQLRMLLVGALDPYGQPWALLLTGPAGFIASPDPRALRISGPGIAGPHPGGITLETGAPIGMLGLDFSTRRRNRANGEILARHGDHIDVVVTESFGNCPKYIQSRESEPDAAHRLAGAPCHADALDESDQQWIAEADTFFIASTYPPGNRSGRAGVDISHRGGKPGFVEVIDNRHLRFPDYAGNHFFNTLGNLTLHPRAGLLFIDFDNGDLLYLSVEAIVLWDRDNQTHSVELTIRQRIRVPTALPWQWQPPAYSPFL
ncbi:MAG: pyridoxamine 5'-phosphate oxidase family protein [Alcanivorax sp.]|uniref:pyridoxamine 5'-phosphate oxidase family protein n=1 Tax=Alcanivorax sp. TaxID=1872427 RepID=UPI002613511A|nr:pyridoxamine 5'-phosphate oxidase family protein [Alcanivorax sp.]MDF1723526.1 pyridoxamine 5'-phosphate oxidase family protein [Alcanivorax sp.]